MAILHSLARWELGPSTLPITTSPNACRLRAVRFVQHQQDVQHKDVSLGIDLTLIYLASYMVFEVRQ